MFPATPIRTARGTSSAQVQRIEMEARYEHFKATQSALTPAPDTSDIRITVLAAQSGARYEQFAYDLGPEWSPEAAYIFSHGHCHSLAQSLAERGYTIAGAVTKHALPAHREEMATHFFAVDPQDNGYGIDIYGRRPVADILDDFGADISFIVKDPVKVFTDRAEQGTLLPVDRRAGERAAGWVLSGSAQVR
jgi:hypothetical protein